MAEATVRLQSNRPAYAFGAAVLLLGAVFAAFWIPSLAAPAAAAALAAAGLALARAALTGTRPTLLSSAIDFAVIAVFLAVRDDGMKLWQQPATWGELLRLSLPGSMTACAFYVVASLAAPARTQRHLSRRESLAVVLVPLLFNLILALNSTALMGQLGSWVTFGLAPTLVEVMIGRALVLVVFVEALVGVLSVVISGRVSADRRMHALLVAAAVHAALTANIADLPEAAAAAGTIVQFAVAIVAAAIAQAGIWAVVYLLTGIVIDALGDTPPTFEVAQRHWRNGVTKGLIYGGLFMLFLLLASAFLRTPALMQAVRDAPLLAAMVGGALLFPLAQTIVGSADGTPPFFGRLLAAYRNPRGYVRGVVVGAGACLALTSDLRHQDSLIRFLAMFAVGALAYAGVDLLADAASLAAGRRRVIETWRVYFLGALLGGLVGGALGWYFDAPQLEVVAAKFWAYTDLSYPQAGRKVTEFSTYPWFNKWGELNLGPVGGGVRLFFNESLSGVINWSIAAPLFGVNFFVLSALFQRSLTPLKKLVSAEGFRGLVEQAVRVMRWGLWMAPVINSFLRQSPDPSWYNQDGAVRSIGATLASVFLPADTFRNSSLAVFTGLLAYDWLRVLIWFDHMGLRVATLVNLSFIGGDRADEAAAHFAGHSARTRFIPEGIRRFGTWAPLLIPFYIPHGAEWDTAWTGAEQIAKTHPPIATPVIALVVLYAVAAVLAGVAVWLIARAWDTRGRRAGPALPGVPLVVAQNQAGFELSSGFLRLDLLADGRGYAHLEGRARGGIAIDLTRRLVDPLHLRGPFLYLREDTGAPWSLGYEPMHRAGSDYGAAQEKPNCVRFVNTVMGVCTEAEVSLAEDSATAIWRVTLSDIEGLARRVRLTTFREIALHEPGSYVRDPDFNAMHVQTWFVRASSAVFGRNRLLRDPQWHRSREVLFHAVGPAEGVRLIGYEDSRTRFIGTGEIRGPQGLDDGRPRALDDEGSLFTFDPAASLTVEVELPSKGSRTLVFVDGHAADEVTAARLIAAATGAPAPTEADLHAAMARTRDIEPDAPPPAGTWPFGFSEDGTELHLTPRTPRPWAHVLANASGFGAVVSNEGEIHSFAGNERQNALTPFSMESVPTSMPGQLIYVVDMETGEADTAGLVPFRREDARYDVTYGLGTAVFRNTRRDIEIELKYFVLPFGRADIRLLTVRNRTRSARQYRIVAYFDMVLAENPGESLGRLTAERDQTSEALLFNNPANDFQRGWAIATTSLTAAATETVRTRFVGSAGRDLSNPVMVETGLPDSTIQDDGRRVAAFSGLVDVGAGAEVDVAVVLAHAETRHQGLMLTSHLRDPAVARATLEATRAWWAERLNAIHIETNQPDFDRLVNYWLPHQVLAARLWGRTGPNQRGGALGFRDQLQDVLPLLFFDSNLVRRQIVLHAGQQFPEGDVLKWWHLAPDGRTGIGMRTRASDPHLWLPYVVARYVESTGDTSVLDERVAYLEAPTIPDGAIDLLVFPRASRETGTVYDHCVRAIEYALARMGSHGLPLVGTGDWNDGIDALGPKGESVWMGFFLHDILTGFGEVARARPGEAARADRYRAEAERLRGVFDVAWRGDHYVLAFDSNGTPLSGASGMTASWPVLSGAVGFERGRAALEGPLVELEKEHHILLLTPPFDENSHPYPGRIADYPAGVRENGGQYSHGVSWMVDAYVRLAHLAREKGDLATAGEMMARAFVCWRKISPLGKTEGAQLAIYGLAPHQQAADIYDGPGYVGRGGWSWYTGSAARMLSAAYDMLGLSMRDGAIIVPGDLFEPKGELRVKTLRIKGQLVTAAAQVHQETAVAAPV